VTLDNCFYERDFIMKRFIPFLLVAVLFISIFSVSPAQADPLRYFTDYMYLTNYETTMFNEIVWFWTPDTMYGNVHSNGQIGIKFAPQFLGQVSTSEDRFVYFSANPYFAYDPLFNVPEVPFPSRGGWLFDQYAEMAEEQNFFFGNNDDALQSRLSGGEDGWHLTQWARGLPYDPDHLTTSIEFNYEDGGDWLVTYIEGDLQLAAATGAVNGFGGETGVVEGRNLIVASGNISLWDNVMLAGTDVEDWRIPDNSQHFINLLSGRRIEIEDNYSNGRGNGRNQGNHERHSIVIHAGLQALGESFSMEHQNDSWHTYIFCACPGENCGSLDERGSIYFEGSLTQARRGYIHRSNCGGTGYAKDYFYDERWLENPPPGLSPYGNTSEDYVWVDTTVYIDDDFWQTYYKSLTIGAGARVIFREGKRLFIDLFSDVTIRGEEGNPARLIIEDDENEGPFVYERDYGRNSFDNNPVWEYLEIEMNGGTLFCPSVLKNSSVTSDEDVNLHMLECDTVPRIENCSFSGDFIIMADVEDDSVFILDHDEFVGDITLDVNNDSVMIELSRTVVSGQLSLLNPAIVEHTVFSAREEDNRSTALFAHRQTFVRNSFFFGAYRTAFNGNAPNQIVSYSGTYGTTTENPWGYFVEEGDGIFEADPKFVSISRRDFHLQPDSPLIDAGDPESPNDPDSSRADVGVYPFVEDYWDIGDELTDTGLPECFTVDGPYPNPFNSSVRFRVELPHGEQVKIDLYNLEGRLVRSFSTKDINTSSSEITLDLNEFATGMYLFRFSTNNQTRVVKAVLIR